MRWRKRDEAEPEPQEASVEGAVETSAPPGRPHGPWDESEVSLEEDDQTRVDFGGLVVRGREGIDVRAQADPRTGAAMAVLLVAPESAVELRPFATPTHEQIWDEVRAEIAADTTKQGGRADEVDGPYGIELLLDRQVDLPDGKRGVQLSRVVGIEGPRWFLRATFLGALARDDDREAALWQALRDVVVRRGAAPMAPREAIPLALPQGAVPAPDQDATN